MANKKEFPKGKRLRDLCGIGLAEPFLLNNSVNRAMLHFNGLRQSVVLRNPEPPLVETLYAPDVLRSTFNIKAKDNWEILYKIPKIIGGVDTEVFTVILVNHVTKEIDLHEVNKWIPMNNDYGVENTSSLYNKGVGDKLTSEDYLDRCSSHTDDGVCLGKNIFTMFLSSIDTIEDAIIPAEEIMEEVEMNCVYEFNVIVNFNKHILKTLFYNGESPVLRIGDCIDDRGVAFATSNINNGTGNIFKSKSFMETICANDQPYYIPAGSRLVDMDIKTVDVNNIHSATLKDYYMDICQYNTNIHTAIVNSVIETGYKMTFNAENKKLYLDVTTMDVNTGKIKASGYRNQKNVIPPNSIVISFKFEKAGKITPAHKMSGRHGNKGVVNGSEIHTIFGNNMLRTEDGTPIGAILNTMGVINRSNVGQLYEKYIAGAMHTIYMLSVNRGIQDITKPIEERNVLADRMFNAIKTVYKWMAPEFLEIFSNVITRREGTLLEKMLGIIEKPLTTYVNPVPDCDDAEFEVYRMNTLRRAHSLHKELKVLDFEVKRKRIFIKNAYDEWIFTGIEAEVAPMYFYILEQSPEKKFVGRQLGAFDSKGSPTKTRGKKERKNKYNDTPVKLGERDLLLLLSMNETDAVYKMLQQSSSENASILNALFKGLGVKMVLSDIKKPDDKSDE